MIRFIFIEEFISDINEGNLFRDSFNMIYHILEIISDILIFSYLKNGNLI